jgi:FdhD protein
MKECLVQDGHLASACSPVNATYAAHETDQGRLVCIAEETPIAFRYEGFSHAVMMATPADLEDFAVGFTRSEGIIEASTDLQQMVIHQNGEGAVIDISLSGRTLQRYLASRRVRQLSGRTSCGLCGVEDLSDIRRPLSHVRTARPLNLKMVRSALSELRQWQPLSRVTRGAHASAWIALDGTLRTVREDVGRHNSLDKLIGAMLRGGQLTDDGFCLITSRCSFEMVQKAVVAGFPALVSAGAPTALAIRLAESAGLTLYSLSRDGEPLQFTSPAQFEAAT